MPQLSFLPRVDINPSVLYDRLRSSSSHQRSEISQILKNLDNDLEDYASEIYTLGARIAFLNSQRERLQNHRLILSTLLSPVHRLSNELLTRIFIFACACECGEPWDVHCANEYTLRVAAVCCRWRGLAISCSRLWSNISLTLPATAVSESRLQNRLDLFLTRSRQHLLTLDIRIDDCSRDFFLLEKLLEHAPRWQHLCLSISMHKRDELPSLYNAHLPSLETYIGDNIFFRNPFPSNNIRSISTIQSLSFLTTMSPPLANKVTHLAFAPHPDSLFEPLSWFPNLVHLALRSKFGGGAPTGSSPRSVSVTSLDISTKIMVSDLNGTIDLLGAAMDFLTAPGLSALVITSVAPPKEFTKATLSYSFSRIYIFIERSGCSLTVLKLHKLSIPDSCIIDFLRHLCSLIELSLEDPRNHRRMNCSQVLDYPISRYLIESLHTHQQSSLHLSGRPIVPNLRTLVLRVCKTGFHHPSFVSTVSSRWIPNKTAAAEIGVVCLCSVELHLSEPVNEVDYLPLVPLEKSSMRIVVKGTKLKV